MDVLIIGRSEDYDVPIEQSLADFGVDWQLRFAADATSALVLAQQQPPDVVVCELRPLGMDGNALLERIRSHAPHAARIMLLEETESAKAGLALSHAHRLLNKPLRVAELVEAVDSIGELRDLLDSPELKTALGKIDRLPPPPKLYLAISRALDDRDSSLSQLADLVAQDPSTAARVLRICNSAYYSNGRAISDVRKAVIRLGQQELRRIVLASEAFRAAPRGIDLEAMRQRSLVASQLAGSIVGDANAELATTAALLAEVGLLLPGVSVCDADGQLSGDGPSYAAAGAYLLGIWGLPMPIVEAVAHHLQPQRAPGRGFWIGGAVHVACALAGGRRVDERYLASVGVAERLPAWRKLAEDLGIRLRLQAEPTPSAAPAPPSASQRRQAAQALLESLHTTQIERDGVHYLLVGLLLDAPPPADWLEAACLLQRYDALAVALCATRLAADPAEAIDPPPARLRDALGGAAGAARLGRWAYARSATRLARALGQPVDAAYAAAIEIAHRRKLSLWPIDRELSRSLQRVVEQLGWRRRLALWWQNRPGHGADALGALTAAALADGDDIALCFAEVDAGDEGIRRCLYAERERHMAASLREQARQQQARRVLVLAADRHLQGIKRALRDGE